MQNNPEYFMTLALKEAKKAYAKGEIPVGCVITYQGDVIAKAHNTRVAEQSILGHAEINAIKKANKKLNSWMLDDCTLYVTLEPCLMCAGAILQSRIKKVYFAASEPKHGALGSVTNVLANNKFNHQVEIESGLLENISSELLKTFFKELRLKK